MATMIRVVIFASVICSILYSTYGQACDDGYYGDTCTEPCGFCASSDTCLKSNGSCSGTCMEGWSGDLCNTRMSVAEDKAATQTPGTFAQSAARRAVDGCLDQSNPDTSGCCSTAIDETAQPPQVSWSVDLGAPVMVSLIRVMGRSDGQPAQLEDFFVFTQEQTIGNEEREYDNTNIAYGDGIFNVTINPSKLVQFVHIRRDGPVLTLCEVQVFRVCPDGSYDTDCSGRCGRCANNAVCDPASGACPDGCAPGWLGTNCDISCEDGKYGLDCNETCNACVHDEPCDKEDGSCINGCDEGWTSTMCDQECSNGTYGRNCANDCGNCYGDVTCDIFDGTCPDGCAAGWEGPTCNMSCGASNYGMDCSDVCNCQGGVACDPVTGICPNAACSDGWIGVTCNESCSAQTYGENCSAPCGNCLNGEACNHVNGTCENACDPGWLQETCSEACAVGFYGDGCMMECGFCVDDGSCDKTDGQCPGGCAPGWKGVNCDEGCVNGTFGANCTGRCYCANNVPCDIISGLCPNNLCDFGYTGAFCHQDLNRAKGLPALQSTVLMTAFNWTAELAVDGNADQSDPDISRTCSATQPSDNPWWSVDMGSITVIDSIFVYGRADGSEQQLQGFELFLENTTAGATTSVYNSTGMAYGDGVFNVTLDSSVLARHIRIVLPGSSFRVLTLCEVRVFGECPDMTFGAECENRCYCADDLVCNKSSGVCPNGKCQPGWELESCSQECQGAMYGQDCLETCGTCSDGTECNKVNGTCESGCAPGWLDDNCTRACDDGFYGHECNSTCENCKNDPCDKADGSCAEGCAAGYFGLQCQNPCDNNTFGENCVSTCGNCNDNATCDAMTGTCTSGCIDGFQPPTCKAEAISGSESDDSGLSTGAIVGIIVGCVGAVLLVAIIYKCVMKRKKQKMTSRMQGYEYPSERASQDQASSGYSSGYEVNRAYVSQRNSMTKL